MLFRLQGDNHFNRQAAIARICEKAALTFFPHSSEKGFQMLRLSTRARRFLPYAVLFALLLIATYQIAIHVPAPMIGG